MAEPDLRRRRGRGSPGWRLVAASAGGAAIAGALAVFLECSPWLAG